MIDGITKIILKKSIMTDLPFIALIYKGIILIGSIEAKSRHYLMKEIRSRKYDLSVVEDRTGMESPNVDKKRRERRRLKKLQLQSQSPVDVEVNGPVTE